MKTKRSTRGRVLAATVILLFAAAAVASYLTMDQVGINYNLADYLGENTQTKIALDIIEDEFGMTGSVQVMVPAVSAEEAQDICDRLGEIPHVLNVNFDRYDTAYYKENTALFAVITDGDDYSDNAKQVVAEIRTALAGYSGVELGGTAVEKQSLQDSITGEMDKILILALCLVVCILLTTSESWLEPFVLLGASGVAVLINRGTNVFFGEISYITNSIAAILQLALSVDYSIVLLHTYRNLRESMDDDAAAMARAIKSVAKPVSASALTTIAGLLALLFMSFKIGFDIGIVLMKGIVISAITSLTLLPSLVLLLDKPMKRLKKKALAPKGRGFCTLAEKAGKVILPIALAVVVLCAVLQTGNTFLFTDSKAGNAAISDMFGSNNSVVVVYPSTEDTAEQEKSLTALLADYKTADGKSVLTGTTAYSNTAREPYDVEKAVQKLELSEKDTQRLFAMYELYSDPTALRLPLAEVVRYAQQLTETDGDVQEFVDADTSKTLRMLNALRDVLTTEQTAEELYDALSAEVFDGAELDSFAIRQLYGLHFYKDIPEQQVDFQAMLQFLTSGNETLQGFLDGETAAQLAALRDGIAQFNAQMEQPMNAAALQGWLHQNVGLSLGQAQVEGIFQGYFAAAGESGETAAFLPLMRFLAESGQLPEQAAAQIAGYSALYDAIHADYAYDAFLPALAQIAQGLSGQAPALTVDADSIQQVYILYAAEQGNLPTFRMTGEAFAQAALEADASNSLVHSMLTEENRNRLNDMCTAAKYLTDTKLMTYPQAYQALSALQSEIKTASSAAALDEEKVSGVFICYAAERDLLLSEPVEARDLLNFVSTNMDTNSLLVRKMSEENRRKVQDAQKNVTKAEDLFLGTRYSRMLLSVDLPNESQETTDFVEYLSGEVQDIFGSDAHIAGEIVSTYDLESTFSHDNRFITVFTLISIFVIVMVIFRSVSVPVILVLIIQGAIFIAMSTQLAGDGIFFMSYIVTTCILMGATIDYGILMSSNYVADRQLYDRKESLRMSVEAAMPTVFTSGLILSVCGFVIHFVSSQSSISTVGLLLGIGTICSVVMITVVLPAVLYCLDGFVRKLSMKK